MEGNISLIFLQSAQREFHFLVEEYDFLGPFRDFSEGSLSRVYHIWFEKTNIRIEFSLEAIRDEDLTCYIRRLKEGITQDGWEYNSRGECVRIYFGAWLLSQVKSNLFSDISKLSFPERIPVRMEDYSRLLKKYGRRFLEDNPSDFILRDK